MPWYHLSCSQRQGSVVLGHGASNLLHGLLVETQLTQTMGKATPRNDGLRATMDLVLRTADLPELPGKVKAMVV